MIRSVLQSSNLRKKSASYLSSAIHNIRGDTNATLFDKRQSTFIDYVFIANEKFSELNLLSIDIDKELFLFSVRAYLGISFFCDKNGNDNKKEVIQLEMSL